MRIKPLFHAYSYLILGLLFIYFAFQAIDDTVLNPLTIFLTLIATFDLGASFRLFKVHQRIKKKQNKHSDD